MALPVLHAPPLGPTKPRPVGPIRLAVVGCGAVTKHNHLPILAGHDGIALTTLVDLDEGRARELARAYSVPNVLTSLDALTTDVIDAVLLATPPAHHAPATIALAARGIHVFVEKPMAIKTADAEAMVEAADRAGVALAVGLYRRTLPVVQLVKRVLAASDFGRALGVDIEEGGSYGWQLATLDLLTPTGGGGGVLIDIGSHLIDLILHMLPGDARLDSYQDNARGGIETDALARFTITTSSRHDVPVRMELSRTRELRNSVRIRCEQATLEILRGDFLRLQVHRADGATTATPFRMTADVPGTENFIGYDAFRAQIDDWVQTIGGREPALSGRSVVPVVRLIESCYTQRSSMAEPWVDEGLKLSPTATNVARSASTPRRRRVVVTGAGGFLGCRTVELLTHGYGYDAVALIKEPRSAARLARWPQEIILGDVCSAADMDRAMRGCDAVVHCAVGTSWVASETRRVTVDGTRTVAEAAARAGVKRFVHISSMAVHRRVTSGMVDESVPIDPAAHDDYGLAKRDAEREVSKVAGLSSIILRPARIYGPFSKTFTVRPLEARLRGALAISGNPDVPANMVYVDNVVESIARALDAPESLSGQAYLINDPDQMSLRDFYDAFAEPGALPLRLMPARSDAAVSEGFVRRWISGCKAIVLSPEVRALVHRVLDTDPVGTLPRRFWESSPGMQRKLLKLFRVDAVMVYRPATVTTESEPLCYFGDDALVSSAKAARDLGFVPAVRPDHAIALTRAWARSARLLS